MKGLPKTLRPHDVLEAAKLIDDRDRDDLDGIDFGKATGYYAIVDGKQYAPKELAGVAARLATGETYGSKDFSGGEGAGQANRVLWDLGFEVEPQEPGRAWDDVLAAVTSKGKQSHYRPLALLAALDLIRTGKCRPDAVPFEGRWCTNPIGRASPLPLTISASNSHRAGPAQD